MKYEGEAGEEFREFRPMLPQEWGFLGVGDPGVVDTLPLVKALLGLNGKVEPGNRAEVIALTAEVVEVGAGQASGEWRRHGFLRRCLRTRQPAGLLEQGWDRRGVGSVAGRHRWRGRFSDRANSE